jgi:hypothetical protein
MKKILPIFLLLLAVKLTQAQTAASYVYSTNASTGIEILTSPTSLLASGLDDAASSLTAIGFTFNFAGTPYTTFSASSNGLLCLGTTAPTTYTNLFPGTVSTFPFFMPFWDDLYTAGNGVRYQVFGTAPNRKLVVEWEVHNCCTVVPADKKFQAWLSETSNQIHFVYDFGANVNSSTIGIANTAADYQSVTSSTHTVSTSVVENANATWPGSSRAYIFSPPVPCTGTPSAGTATVSPNPPCPGSNFFVSLTGASVTTGLTYQWLSSPTGNPGTWSIIPLATNPTYSTSLPASTTIYYRCRVQCTTSSGFDTSLPVTVNVQGWSPTSNCYCNSQASFATYEEIENVTMGTLNNTTTCATPLVGSQGIGTGVANQSANFTGSVPAPVIYIGLVQPFSVTISNCTATNLGSGTKIYIDYNQNASFSDPGEEVYFSGLTATNSVPSTILSGTFTPPVTALPGITRMRVVNQVGGNATPTTITPCNTYNYGETEDYLVNIIPPSNYDPAVTAISTPGGNCFTASQILTATVRNYGSLPIVLGPNDSLFVNLHVNGPNGLVTYYDTLFAGTNLLAFGNSTATALFTGVNMFAGGTYSINTSLSISTNFSNGNLINDSLNSPIIKVNYRPTAGAPYQLCQYSSIPFGQGLTVSGCSAPLNDSVTINFVITGPCTDNIGATGGGTSFGLPANCADQFACAFANGIIPALPPGSSFTQPGVLTVSNLGTIGSSYVSEVRMNLYSTNPIGANLLSPGLAGGVGTTNPQFNYSRNIPITQLGNIFSAIPANGILNLGYWESYNDNAGASDISINSGGTTVATLKIYYQYVPASFNWFTVPSGPNPSIFSLSPFDPLITTGSGLSNSNTPGTYTFYAACSSSPTCRVPVQLQINPTPAAFQDTLGQCEYAVSSNSSIFDLSTLNSSVSGNNPLTDVYYYYDQSLAALIANPPIDTFSTNYIYSKVFIPSTGCYSSDTVLLEVISLPEFPSPVLSGFACAPGAIDVANLIDPFSTSPIGTDTIYYNDASFTTLHPNPHNVTVADTVYVVFATNSSPVCSDTTVAYVDILPANNYISGQVLIPSIYSNAGSYSCMSTSLADGQADTIRSTTDCRRVASVTDILNGTSLGTVSACLDIAPSTPFYNGQPYVNRAYTITPTTNDTGYVCLYYLDQDFQDYNADAFILNWPLLPTAATMPSNMQNVALTKVSNGALGAIGSVPTAIPNTSINVSYDPASTVWTVCAPAEGFSHFYLHAQNPGNVPLPVSLLRFNGQKVDATTVLNWATSSERNNSHFVVERSRDGKSFTRVSSNIESKGLNGNSDVELSYNFTDTKPFDGHNYYRLEQHDLDQNMSLSQVVDVYFGNETMVTVYPNPVSSLLTVDINTPKVTTAQMKIIDATGRVVRMTDMLLQAGANQTQIDLQSLADGVYMIHITNGKGLNYSQPIRKN